MKNTYAAFTPTYKGAKLIEKKLQRMGKQTKIVKTTYKGQKGYDVKYTGKIAGSTKPRKIRGYYKYSK